LSSHDWLAVVELIARLQLNALPARLPLQIISLKSQREITLVAGQLSRQRDVSTLSLPGPIFTQGGSLD